MKVLMLNGSPRAKGNTTLALAEMEKVFAAEGVEDPYTPDGIADPVTPGPGDDLGNDHTFTHTWATAYPEQMRRAEAAPGTGEAVHPIEGRTEA